MKVRLESMSKLHCFFFMVALISSIVVIFGASFKASYMLIYNTGDSYMCATNSNAGIQSEAATSASKCLQAFHHDGYIWLGRLENLELKNQVLLVYGYVQQSPYENKTAYQDKPRFDVKYSVYIRGKNDQDQEWASISAETDETNSIECKSDSNLCGIILVAHIPILEYKTYDVYIELKNKDEIDQNLLQNMHFKMAYINKDFTDTQLAVRVVFMALSLIFCIVYLCKICKVPRNDQQTYDQKQLVWISIALVLFNDPTYALNIYKPTFYSYIVSQLWLAIFFTLLLQYWLRSAQRIKDEPTEQMLRQRSISQSMGVRKRSPLEKAKIVFFVFFLLDILALYVLYIFNVKDNPTFYHIDQMPPVLIGIVAATAVFLVIYAAMYLVTLFMNFYYFCQLTNKSRIMFLYSLLMLFICLFSLIFGVYSPFYYNGQIFIFFIALFNIYVWSLIYLNWPVETAEMIRLGEEIEMEIRFSRGDDHHKGYDMRNAHHGNGIGGGHHSKKGKMKVETEEEKQTDNSQIIGTGTRDIQVEF